MAESGEIKLLLRDIKQMSESMMADLQDIDRRLGDLQAAAGSITVPELLREIKDIRTAIGGLEREESEEIEAEDITQNLLEKLSEVIEKCLK